MPLAREITPIEICVFNATVPPQGRPGQLYENEVPRDQLKWLTCALRDKANANLAQAQEWENRTEWRDIPLLGAAATVAGLLLFGERNSDNSLKKGEQETIAGLGFASATFATFANYLSPQKARDILRQSARGHFCLATQGELILSVYDTVERQDRRTQLAALVAVLSGQIANTPGQFTQLEEARSIRDAANLALSTYDNQKHRLDTAAISLGEVAWNFGIDLMSQSDRSEQKVDQLVQAITAQTESVAKFAATEKKAADPVPAAVVQAQLNKLSIAGKSSSSDTLTLTVAMATSVLLNDLVNVDALVLGFDNCASTALAGGKPKASKIQRVTT